MNGRLKLKGRIFTHLIYPIVISVVLFLVGIWIALKDGDAGSLILSLSIVYFIFTVVMYVVNQKLVMQELVKFASDYAQIQKELLEDMLIPYGLIDRQGNILWQDEELARLLKRNYGKKVQEVFKEITDEQLELTDEIREININFKEHFYRVQLKKVNTDNIFSNSGILQIENQEYMAAIYLLDETRLRRLERENIDQKLVVGLIYVDNYEEVLQSVEDVRASLLAALIDRKINKFISGLDGIVRKLEKDKYFIIFKRQALDAVRSDKFSIIDDIKTVSIGNELQVTVSIGIGVGAETYSQLSDYSRAAMDLALGRGGDQAVVKDGENIYYYGGKTKQVEKNTRVKARIKAHALREIIESKESLLIMGHKISDIDSLGAAIGIHKAAKVLNKQAHIILNDITASLRPMVDRFIEHEEFGAEMFIKSEQAVEMIDGNTLVVVVDVNKPSRTECPEVLTMTKSIVVLDHHRQTSEVIENALLAYIEPFASSTCEMVAEILQYIQDGIRLKAVEADAMYGGIVIDTNNFVQKTGVRTFEAAAFLKRHGADVVRVKKLFRDNFSDYKWRADSVSKAEIFMDCFAITVCESEGVQSPTVLCAQVANELLDINGIEASFVLTDYNDKIYISARSLDSINVQLIMERLGGGGHMNMAGAQIKDRTVREVKYQVIQTIKQMREDKAI
ncbi:MAG: DHH family phosphoesterase [Lachnospiraceae bacterium]|nr:DHH family phosphoesterase [Lachnospiraceae bacterium]MCI8826289.1 DHH family phosphoesterase [Lachnospiraceae bacterium]MCI9369017.1 DHH family phosphoesterase [Lachnospiraceae bacterium]